MSYVFEEVFDRSIVVITSVESSGVSGLVLTSPMWVTFRELLGRLPIPYPTPENIQAGPMLDMPLFMGGPMIFAPMLGDVNWLVTCSDVIGSREILPSVWAGGEVESMLALAAEDKSKVCLFLGFAGWDRNQLKNELERGMWVHARIISNDGCQLVGTDKPLTIWKALLHRAGMHCLAEFPREGSVDEKLRKLLAEFNKWTAKKLTPETGCGEVERGRPLRWPR